MSSSSSSTNPIDIQNTVHGTTALIAAVKSNRLSTIQQLCEVYNANIQIKDYSGKNALDYATELNYSHIVTYLKHHIRITQQPYTGTNDDPSHQSNNTHAVEVIHYQSLDELFNELLDPPITSSSSLDSSYRNILLCTLPYYTTPLTLIQHITKHLLSLPSSKSGYNKNYTQHSTQRMISVDEWRQHNLRVFGILTVWLREYGYEDFYLYPHIHHLSSSESQNDVTQVYSKFYSLLSNYPPPSFALHQIDGTYVDITGMQSIAHICIELLDKIQKEFKIGNVKGVASLNHTIPIELMAQKDSTTNNINVLTNKTVALNISSRKLLKLPNLFDLQSSAYKSSHIASHLHTCSIQRMRSIRMRQLCRYMRDHDDMENNNTSNGNGINQMKYSNQMSLWVATEILTQNDKENRILAFKKYMNIADQLYAVNDYNTVFEILYGMNHQSLYRLHLYDALNTSDRAVYDKLCTFVSSDSNYGVYRDALQQCKTNNLHCIPYYGVLFKDMIAIEESINPIVRQADKFINHNKLKSLYHVMTSFLAASKHEALCVIDKEKLNKFHDIMKHIDYACTLTQSCPLPEDELELLSCTIQPRVDKKLPPSAKQYEPLKRQLMMLKKHPGEKIHREDNDNEYGDGIGIGIGIGTGMGDHSIYQGMDSENEDMEFDRVG